MLEVSELTREFIYHDVTTENDLTATQGYVAFMDPNVKPGPTDWVEGVLEVTSNGYSIRVLVGSGHVDAVTLAIGDYQTWTRLVDNPEEPVDKAGTLSVV